MEIDVATARLNTVFNDARDAFGEVVLEKLLARRDPIRLNAHYFRMMWSALAAARLERCVEICDAGTELAVSGRFDSGGWFVGGDEVRRAP